MGVSISETHEEKGSKIKTLKAFSQISHALVNFQLSDSSTTHLQLCTFCDVRRAQQEGWDRKLIKSKIFWEIKPASRFEKFEKVFSFFCGWEVACCLLVYLCSRQTFCLTITLQSFFFAQKNVADCQRRLCFFRFTVSGSEIVEMEISIRLRERIFVFFNLYALLHQ